MQYYTLLVSKAMASNSLLNTKEAAEFLRVSEASIRRWSDAGLLAAQRVGRRRERRFASGELRRFLEKPSGDPRPAGPEPSTVNVGGTSVPLRTHLAPIHSSDLGGLRLSVPFLADGLRAGQPCFLVAAGALRDRYKDALIDEHIDVAAALDSGRLVIIPGPGIDVADAISNWERLFGKALAGGPTVLRVIAEMGCVRTVFGSEAAMMACEEAYELMAKRFPVVTLCQYDAREFDGEILLRALKSHPDMFEQHMGGFLN
jgi:excisionase family DNA binding protein